MSTGKGPLTRRILTASHVMLGCLARILDKKSNVSSHQEIIRARPQKYVGGCQNYGPFLGPYYITAPNI